MSNEWSCCKDGVCKHCGEKLADCKPKDGDEGCGAHIVLPDTDVSKHVDRHGMKEKR